MGMTSKQKRDLKKIQLFQKGSGHYITDPINKELLKMLVEDALEAFKSYYGKYDKRLLANGFRSYRYEINGCNIYIETTYKHGLKCGQCYDLNRFI